MRPIIAIALVGCQTVAGVADHDVQPCPSYTEIVAEEEAPQVDLTEMHGVYERTGPLGDDGPELPPLTLTLDNAAWSGEWEREVSEDLGPEGCLQPTGHAKRCVRLHADLDGAIHESLCVHEGAGGEIRWGGLRFDTSTIPGVESAMDEWAATEHVGGVIAEQDKPIYVCAGGVFGEEPVTMRISVLIEGTDVASATGRFQTVPRQPLP